MECRSIGRCALATGSFAGEKGLCLTQLIISVARGCCELYGFDFSSMTADRDLYFDIFHSDGMK